MIGRDRSPRRSPSTAEAGRARHKRANPEGTIQRSQNPPVALSIGGSDSSAGAGIQADLKSFSALGVYGCTVITAVTAQNTRTITAIEEIKSDLIRKQIHSILTDIPPDAIKIGMVYNKKVIKTICDSLQDVKVPIVLDPVMSSGSGVKLLVDNDLQFYISNLIPLSTVITPNLMEAQK